MMSVMKSMNLISVHFLDVEVVLNLSKAALLTSLLRNWHLLSSFSAGLAASREFLCHSFDQDDTRTTRRENILAPILTTCTHFRITLG